MNFHLQYKKYNGKIWLLLFKHDLTVKEWFADQYEALYFDNPNQPNKFSILSILSDLYKIDGVFEFIIDYNDMSDFVQWKQDINPIYQEEGNETTNGYLHTGGTQDSIFGGLSRTTIKYNTCFPSFLNGDTKNREWYYAIGMYSEQVCPTDWSHDQHPGIARKGFNKVALWLRVSKISQCMTFQRNHLLETMYLFLYVSIL